MSTQFTKYRSAHMAGFILLAGALLTSEAWSETGGQRATPEERVNFGNGEWVTLRVTAMESPWIIEGPLAPQYADLAARVKSGDVVAAENLYTATKQCARTYRTRTELDAAVSLLRVERKLKFPNADPVVVRNDLDIEPLVQGALIEPYFLCEGLTTEQRSSTQHWMAVAVDLGSVDAAIAALETEQDEAEQERLHAIVWDGGYPEVLEAQAKFYERRSQSLNAQPGDLLQAYARQFALNELAKFSARNQPPGPLRTRLFNEFANDLARLERQLTLEQRDAAIELAANLVRSNPNCCAAL